MNEALIMHRLNRFRHFTNQLEAVGKQRSVLSPNGLIQTWSVDVLHQNVLLAGRRFTILIGLNDVVVLNLKRDLSFWRFFEPFKTVVEVLSFFVIE